MAKTSTLSFVRVAIFDVSRRGVELEEPGALIPNARLIIDTDYELRMSQGFGNVATRRLKAGAVLLFGPDNGPWESVVLDKDHTDGVIWLPYKP